MENQEIMTNNEVLEVAEDLVPTSSGKGLKVFGAVLAVAGLAFGGYKLIKNRKSKQKYGEPKPCADIIDIDEYDADETDND